jgi:hypothetical protein
MHAKRSFKPFGQNQNQAAKSRPAGAERHFSMEAKAGLCSHHRSNPWDKFPVMLLLCSAPDEIKIKARAEEACTVGLAWETQREEASP